MLKLKYRILISVFVLACLAHSTVQAQGLPGDLRFETVVSGLTNPLGVRHAFDDRLFVIQQDGRIRIIDGGVLQVAPFLNIDVAQAGTAPPLGFSSGGERGLLGLAFDPAYPSNGRFYINYTDAEGDTVIARYQVSLADPDVADAASGQVVLRVGQDFGNHNGGDLHFGLDGMLYIAMGDGGSANDPCNRAQTLAPASLNNNGGCAASTDFTSTGGNPDSRALLGKLLRIDVSGSGTGGGRCGDGGSATGYAIPTGNPYAEDDGICDEIYASGLRNPYRFSVDRQTGDIWIGDVGQAEREEINRLFTGPGGANFGWRCREGFVATPGIDCSDTPFFTDPVIDHPRSEARSITGGFRYRGPNRGLKGMVFYGDFATGRQFAAQFTEGQWQSVVWRNTGGSPAGYGEDFAGNLYMADYGGTIFRLEATDPVIFSSGMEPE